MPDTQNILLSQIEALGRELARTGSLLNDVPLPFDAAVRDRAVGEFEKLLGREQSELAAIRARVMEGDVTAESWTALQRIAARTTPLFAESLAFLEGALARENGLDDGLCRLVDSLLDELSTRTGVMWERFTILADGEFFAGTADIIRIRFPDTSVWSLPVAAHEFGHFAGPALTSSTSAGTVHPFEILVQREAPAWKAPHVHELFADVFATYTLGPAYAFTCVAGRFDPSRAYLDAIGHPAPAKRVHAVLGTLARIAQEEDQAGGYQAPVGELAEAWTSLLAVGGQAEPPEYAGGSATIVDLDRLVDALYDLLKEQLRPRGMYGAERLLTAQQLAGAIGRSAQLGDRSLPELPDGVLLADIVNAAWLARWRNWELTPELGHIVADLYDSLVGAPRARARR